MKCRECAEGKRHSRTSVFCIQYGIVVRAEHECDREGARIRERERAADHFRDGTQQNQLPEDFWPDIDSMPEFLYGT